MWAWMKRQILERNTQKIDDLLRAVRETWDEITLEYCQALAKSMTKRIAACLANKGGAIKY